MVMRETPKDQDILRDTTAIIVPPFAARNAPEPASSCFPHASSVSQAEAGKQKMAPGGHPKTLIPMEKPGAGEGIRTLDPNLGKAPEGSTPGYPAPRHALIISHKSTS